VNRIYSLDVYVDCYKLHEVAQVAELQSSATEAAFKRLFSSVYTLLVDIRRATKRNPTHAKACDGPVHTPLACVGEKQKL